MAKNVNKEDSQKIKRGIEIRIQIGLMLFLFFTVLIVACVIHFPWQYFSQKNISELVVDLNREIMKGVSNRVGSLFNEALQTQYVVRDNFEKGVVNVLDTKLRDTYYYNLIQSYPNITWFSFGFPNGDFFGAQRENRDKINVVERIWQPDRQTSLSRFDYYERKGVKFEFIARHDFDFDYNSTERSWYRLAIQGNEPIWTPVYVFGTSRKPGINTAIALNINGNFIGIISIAFELEDISLYLQSLKIGKTGSVFIIDTDENLIAAQNPEDIQAQVTKSDQGEDVLSLKNIRNVQNPYIDIARQTLVDNQITLKEVDDFINFTHQEKAFGEEYFVTYMPVNLPTDNLNWIITTVIPSSDYMGEIRQNILYLFLVVFGMLILAILLILFISRRIVVNPILQITDQLEYVQNFQLDKIEIIHSNIKEINILSGAIGRMTQGLLSFQKYIPTEVVQEMLSQGIQAELGGDERELTIFFSDIVSFTNVFEKHGNLLVHQLGRYFGEMSNIIIQQKGAIDKYIGDSIMAFWGAPKKNPAHAIDACRAALESQKALSRLRLQWEKEDKPLLYSRMGINTGTVVVGNMGSNRRLNYTVLGDAVNLSSRLEGLNKFYKTNILIGQTTYDKAREHIIARKIDTVAVYGKTQSENIYELINMRDDVRVTDKFEWITRYEQAYKLYQARDWDKAMQSFREVKLLRGEQDYPSALFIYYCKKYKKDPPPPDWDGATVMKNK